MNKKKPSKSGKSSKGPVTVHGNPPANIGNARKSAVGVQTVVLEFHPPILEGYWLSSLKLSARTSTKFRNAI